jgi:2-iminobutanoate/2-iminopropanoate deaminase
MLELAGATPGDVVQITVWLKERSTGVCLNEEWVAMFPDPLSRPARTLLFNPRLDAPMLVQCDCFAVMPVQRATSAPNTAH